MTSTVSAEPRSAPRQYSSPPHALVWSFRKSRDNWKSKYQEVKAQLKQARRRLDRLEKTHRPSPPCPAETAKPAASFSVAPSLSAVLHQQLLDLRQQVQANNELLEQCQEQHGSLLDLAQQIRHCLECAALPASASPPFAPTSPVQTPHPLPPGNVQAPPEPKKGVALRYGP